MSFSNSTENNIMLAIFNATAWAKVLQNNATTPYTTLNLSLQTADPTDTGTMSTSEATYQSYARTAVNRASGAGGLTVTNNSVSPQANISFPIGTVGAAGSSITFASIGSSDAGATEAFMNGAVSPTIVPGEGVTPIITTASTWTID